MTIQDVRHIPYHVPHPELLAPAGGPAPFAAALAAGADAIYCGMGSFNARRKADNFTDESFEAACRAAHLAGARVYVTVNIVIKDEEMVEALELVRRCTQLGADAFIIQDWGLFHEIRRLMPQVETHISTQANIHDARATTWCRDAGADRVTLSRELSVSEIAAISRVGIDLEVFAHGAICFCYSGVCLLSSFARAGRSANRGMCAQPCRLPYELVDERGRVLSPAVRERPLCPRDTNTSEMISDLLDAGAAALKLEGRMKAPDYVYSVVDAYRRQLDDVLAGRIVDEEEACSRARQLKRCFNRDFTTEYQHGASGDEMMSYERSNNRGQLVGEVLRSRPARRDVRGLHPDDRRRRAAIARIRLFEPVGKGDLLELRHDDEFDQFLTTLAPADAAAGATIVCDVARAMPAGSRVRIIRSQAAIDAASTVLKRDIPRKRPVDVSIQACLGEPFAVTLACADDPSLQATATGFIVEPARTRAVTREDLVEHVGRMGSSAFEAASFSVAMDDACGMGFSAVHKVRAAACETLEHAIRSRPAPTASRPCPPALGYARKRSRQTPRSPMMPCPVHPRRPPSCASPPQTLPLPNSPASSEPISSTWAPMRSRRKASPPPMQQAGESFRSWTRSAGKAIATASTAGSFLRRPSPSATSPNSPWRQRTGRKPNSAHASPCTTAPAPPCSPRRAPASPGSRRSSRSPKSSASAPRRR